MKCAKTSVGRSITCFSLWKGFILYGNIFLTFEMIYPGTGEECLGIKHYYLTNSSSLVVTQTPWKEATSWTGISTLGSCTYEAYIEYLARGIFYNSETGVCAPLVLDSGADVTHNLAHEEGKLYVDLLYACPESFTIFDYNSSIVCIQHSTTLLNYDAATDACNAIGGRLATIKTVAVMQLLVDFRPQTTLWIGLDDQVSEGTYVYQADGSTMTDEQISSLFMLDEPNNFEGTQHCVQLHYSGALNDFDCSGPSGSLCEIVIQVFE